MTRPEQDPARRALRREEEFIRRRQIKEHNGRARELRQAAAELHLRANDLEARARSRTASATRCGGDSSKAADQLQSGSVCRSSATSSSLEQELARRLQTIPGVGPAIAASLIAEIGDIWRFDDFDQLAAFAGTHPKEQSSGRRGERQETSWKMAKTGNAYLRPLPDGCSWYKPIIKEMAEWGQ